MSALTISRRHVFLPHGDAALDQPRRGYERGYTRAMPSSSTELWTKLHVLHRAVPESVPIIELVLRMAMELDALRTALADPRVSEATRAAYRDAYATCSVRYHNSAGAYGGWEKTLAQFFPKDARAEAGPDDDGELEMLRRLGMSDADRAKHHQKLSEVEMYT